ncbi:MAG: hypothetical protein IKT61_02470, partial [Clostridia bacterium]|nr:hypothetical protein [Clostridia bacterium]
MKKIKRLTKRVLSLVLCLAMVATTMLFFDIGLLKTDAAVQEKDPVAFYVPEVIYLYPNAWEWYKPASTPFQYYVENTLNDKNYLDTNYPKPNSDLKSEGKVVFASSKQFDLLEFGANFVREDGTVIESYPYDKYYKDYVAPGANVKDEAGNWYTSLVSTGGKSPSLAVGTQGCYIEWYLTYQIAGEVKTVYAYTYVYKPYTTPYGGVVWVNNTNDGKTRKGGQITWVSGVHKVTAAKADSSFGNQPAYPRFSYDKQMAGFLSANNTGYIGEAGYTGKLSAVGSAIANDNRNYYNPSAKDMYAVFSRGGNYTSNYFYEAPSSNNDCWDWFAGSIASDNPTTLAVYDTASFDHKTNSGGTQNEYVYMKSSAVGQIYIDTSRYTNLSQIPNLGVSLMVTDNNGASYGSWYVADATDYVNKYSNSANGSDDGTNRDNYYNAKGTVMASAGGKDSGSMYGGDNEGAVPQWGGRKYSGTWLRTITDADSSTSAVDGTKVYAVKGYYGMGSTGKAGSGTNAYDVQCLSLTHTIVTLNAVQTDKTALRNAVNNAIKSFGTLGVKANFGSYYYDTNSTAWQNFVSAYKAACKGLVKLDGLCNAATLVSNLDAAITALKNGAGRIYYFDVNHDDINPNLYVYQQNGVQTSGITPTYNSENETIILNGTLTADAKISYTPFSPRVGNYYYSFETLGGSVATGGDNCFTLFESFNTNLTTSPPTVTKLDQLGDLGLSRKSA